MNIGFTGTQRGMTKRQAASVHHLLETFASAAWEVEFHHGDCTGADAEAHEIMRQVAALAHLDDCTIVIHPPSDPKARAFCKGDYTWLPIDYLVRNRDIVDNTRLLIAAPRGEKEALRSGTWATVRYARKQGKAIYLVGPDGTVIREAEKTFLASDQKRS